MLWFFLSLFGLIAALFGVLQLPPVQTYLAQKSAEYLSEALDHKISIHKVSIDWFDEATLKGVKIDGTQGEHMISVEEVYVDFHISALIQGNQIELELVHLKKPDVRLGFYDLKDRDVNINFFIRKILALSKKPKKTVKPFVIDAVNISDGRFSFEDKYKDPMEGNERFDHNHFTLENIYASTDGFFSHKDTFQLDVHRLRAKEVRTGFEIKELNARFGITNTHMEFKELEGYVGEKSHLGNYLRFDFPRLGAMKYFVDSVNITANLDSTVIYTKDLAVFAPPVKRFKDEWTFYGKAKGTVSNFTAKDFQFAFGQKSRLKGRLDLQGLPNIQETFMDISLNNSQLDPKDFRPYITKEKTIKTISLLGKTNVDATFLGFPTSFVAHGDFNTDIGFVKSDLQFETNPDNSLPSYKGDITTKEFDLGKFFQKKDFGPITMTKGHIEGEGFTINEAKIALESEIKSLQIRGYNYSGITTNGNLKDRFFSGKLDIRDSSLVVKAEGTLDLRKGKEAFNLKVDTLFADLHATGISKHPLRINTKVTSNLKGIELDKIEGTAKLEEFSMVFKKDSMFVGDFDFVSLKDSLNNRVFSIDSDPITASIKGNYTFRAVLKDFKNLRKEYVQEFSPRYYTNGTFAPIEHEDYHLDFDFDLKNSSPFLAIVYPDLYISDSTVIQGRMLQGASSMFHLSTQVDTLRWKNFSCYDSELQLSSSRRSDTSALNASIHLLSQQQAIDEKLYTSNFSFQGIWDKKRILFKTRVKQVENNNKALLGGELTLTDSTVNLKLKESEISIYDENWRFNQGHGLTFLPGNKFHIDSLGLISGNQEIMANGFISPNPNDSLWVMTKDFSLLNLKPFTKSTKIEGWTDSKILLQDLMNKPKADGKLHTKELTINDQFLGDLKAESRWKQNSDTLHLKIALERDKTPFAILEGRYDLADDVSPLHFDATLKNARFDFLEAFIGAHISNTQGKITGKAQIRGNLKQPLLYGKAFLKGGAVTLNYFKTRYRFQDYIYFNADSINVKDIVLTDTIHYTRAVLNGGITHADLFKSYRAHARLALNKTFVMNTEAKDNDMFYGKAFGTGTVYFRGPFSDLLIRSQELKTEKGTKVFFPIGSPETIGKQDHIVYRPKEEWNTEIEGGTRLNLSGLRIQTNFNITPDAEFEILLDPQGGDRIRGRGRGQLEVRVDTRGEFNLVGNFEFVQGNYNFSFLNVVDKAFQISKGSRITWSGEPTDGIVDITAKYKRNASPAPLAEDQNATYDKVPVVVYLKLKNRLLTPDITFDIEVEEYSPNAERAIQRLEAVTRNDQQELNKQVFSLLILGQFAPLGISNSEIAGSSAATSSVSELLSNQLGSWLSEVSDNLEIGLETGDFQNTTGTDIRTRLTYKSGRWRVSNYYDFTDNSNANKLGEWTVEYMLSTDGQLRVKLYNRSYQNQDFAGDNNSSATSQYGASLTSTSNFDTRHEFWDNIKTRFEDLTKGVSKKERKRRREKHKRTSPSLIQQQEEENETEEDQDDLNDELKEELKKEQ